MTLPDFQILGCAKCGTTSLAHNLAQHPDVFIPEVKEVNFFANDHNYSRGIAYYQSYYADAPPATKRGDASPQYIYRVEALDRFATAYEGREVNLLLLLRNPVSRAYSSYWQARAIGNETRDFEEAVRVETQDMKAHRHHADGRTLGAYVGAGMYGLQLEPWLTRFPRDKVLILLSEDFREDADSAYQRVHAHIGVEHHTPQGGYEVKNQAALPKNKFINGVLRGRYPGRQFVAQLLPRQFRTRFKRSVDSRNMKPNTYPHMSDSARALLQDVFESDIRLTESLTGRDLSAWLV